MKPTEQEKLQFGIEIVAAMFAERLHNGDLDAGMIDALSETELDRLGYPKEDLDTMPADRLEMIRKMVSFHKTRLHKQAMFMANTVLSSGLISQMQLEPTKHLTEMSAEHFGQIITVGFSPAFVKEIVSRFVSLHGFHSAIANYGHFRSYNKAKELGYDVEFSLPQPPKDINQ